MTDEAEVMMCILALENGYEIYALKYSFFNYIAIDVIKYNERCKFNNFVQNASDKLVLDVFFPTVKYFI